MVDAFSECAAIMLDHKNCAFDIFYSLEKGDSTILK